MPEAKLNYLAPMTNRPVFYLCRPPPGIPVDNVTYEPTPVCIADARLLDPPPSLRREGFQLVFHRTAANLRDPIDVRATYFPEMERLVMSTTGARRVIAINYNVRSSSAAHAPRETASSATDSSRIDVDTAQPPVAIVHNDYTERSSLRRARGVLRAVGDEAALESRFAIVNVWKSMSGTVEQAPLAVCDARTVTPTDLVSGDLVDEHETGELSLLTFRSAHRWFYFPRMREHEAMLFNCYDSDRDRPRFTAHSAFDDPTSKVGAPPRESIEVRTLVLY